MASRLSLRLVGALTGKLAAVPGSLAELLALATKKLKLTSPATRIFTSSGDELDDDDDVVLLREDEVVYVSCGEDFSPVAAADDPALKASEPPPPAAEPAPAAAEPPPAAAEPPPAAVKSSAANPGNPFDIFSLDDSVAEAARAREDAAPAAPVTPISEAATRDLVAAHPQTAFSRMARGGAAPFCLRMIWENASTASPGLYAFCQDPDNYLQKREATPEGEVASSTSTEPPLPPPLLMGEWEKVPVPPDVAKRDKKATWCGGFKPKLSAMKAVFASRQRRKSVAVWEYPSDAVLMNQTVDWHDFKSVVSVVHKVFKDEKAAAAAAAAAAAKPSSGNRGGVGKLEAGFVKAEQERKEKVQKTQEGWSAREADIDTRLKKANDKLARALPTDCEAAQMEVDWIEGELRNFNTARSKEKVQLEEARLDAKRKHQAQVEEQRSYNREVKGGARKKFQKALSEASPMEVEVDQPRGPASASAATLTIGATAVAYDPDMQIAKKVAKAACEAAVALCEADA
jgi:hypothetical protein